MQSDVKHQYRIANGMQKHMHVRCTMRVRIVTYAIDTYAVLTEEKHSERN